MLAVGVMLTIYFSQMKMSSCCKILSHCPVSALVTIDTQIFTLLTHAISHQRDEASQGWTNNGMKKLMQSKIGIGTKIVKLLPSRLFKFQNLALFSQVYTIRCAVCSPD